jgi:capsular polysaccharide biosynthesis protein
MTANEHDLITSLQVLGFQALSMEDYTLNEKAWILKRAEIVIGPSGAGLNNVVFCEPETKVIELRVRPYPTPETWDIANRRGLAFYEVLPEKYVANGKGRPIGLVTVDSVLKTLEIAGLTRASLQS